MTFTFREGRAWLVNGGIGGTGGLDVDEGSAGLTCMTFTFREARAWLVNGGIGGSGGLDVDEGSLTFPEGGRHGLCRLRTSDR